MLGVVPMLDVDVDDEDSLSQRLESARGQGGPGGHCGDPPAPALQLYRLQPPGADGGGQSPLRPLRQEMGHPDLILLPGTKNTMDDLRWLRQSGLENAILKHAAAGGAVTASAAAIRCWAAPSPTPRGGGGGALAGLGLLPTETVFSVKRPDPVTGRFRPGRGLSPVWRGPL